MKKKKIILMVVCILLAVVLIAAIIISIMLGKSADNIEASSSSNKPVKRDPSLHLVTFYSDEGNVIWTEEVANNEAATAPTDPEMSYGSLFLGWKENFSKITADTDVYPEVASIVGVKNAFAIPTVYVKRGETVSIPFRLCGDVDVSGFDLTLEYDAELLELEAVSDEDGDVIYNDEVAGRIRMNFVSGRNVLGDIDICTFKFIAKGSENQTRIKVDIKKMVAVGEDDMMFSPEYTVFDTTVNIY